MRLEPDTEHPHGLPEAQFDALFTPDKPVLFAYRGYPWLIHRLTYRRHNHANLHVRAYKEEGTTTTTNVSRRASTREPTAMTHQEFATGSCLTDRAMPRSALTRPILYG